MFPHLPLSKGPPTLTLKSWLLFSQGPKASPHGLPESKGWARKLHLIIHAGVSSTEGIREIKVWAVSGLLNIVSHVWKLQGYSWRHIPTSSGKSPSPDIKP